MMLLAYSLPIMIVVVNSKSWSPAWARPEPRDTHLPGSQGTHCDHILKITIDDDGGKQQIQRQLLLVQYKQQARPLLSMNNYTPLVIAEMT
jgi:hypothetical protein